MLASPQPVYIAWGPELISLYNDGYIPIAGDKHPGSLGQPYRVMWAEIWDEIRPVIVGVTRDGESHIYYDRPLPVAGRPGRPMGWFTTTASPIRDESGAPAGLYTVALETTNRVIAEKATQQNFEALFNSIDEGYLLADIIFDDYGKAVDIAYVDANPAATRMIGADLRGRRLREVDPEYEDYWYEIWGRVARTGQGERLERYAAPEGRWYDFYVFKPDPDDVKSTRVAVLFHDTSERRQAEAAMRESEERFQQFARASSSGLWIRNAATLAMEFVSPALGTIFGIEPNALMGDVKHWAAMIVPEDRDAALGHIEAARGGDTAVYEFRIQRPSDGTFRWIRNTDFPLRDNGHIPRIGGIVEDVTEARQLTEHQGVLVAELQHRVRNIMAMIRAMANRTAPGASGAEHYRSLLEGRLLALARVQALLTREANAGGSLRHIIESEIAAQAYHGHQYALTGPDITLPPKAVEVLTLAFHELATNALKYGALSVPEGRLSVVWALVERKSGLWVFLDWVEADAPFREPSTRRGFGSELIEARIPYELGGRGTITISPEGARCHLEFPLQGGESILETDAPQPTTVFGGALDMTGAPDLAERKVLVVEDDYYVAHDTAAALRGAGAAVLGPCPSEAATIALLEDEVPTHAVLDLNLGGGGPRFELARLLKARDIPFLFLTGYDPDQIPDDMRDVMRLAKPLPYRAIVEAVGRL